MKRSFLSLQRPMFLQGPRLDLAVSFARELLCGLTALLMLSGCRVYSLRDRVVSVVDMQTGQPAADKEIRFSNAEIILIPPRPKGIAVRLDATGKARVRLPTVIASVSIGNSSTMIAPETVVRGETFLLAGYETKKFGPQDSDVREVALPPKYRVTISKPGANLLKSTFPRETVAEPDPSPVTKWGFVGPWKNPYRSASSLAGVCVQQFPDSDDWKRPGYNTGHPAALKFYFWDGRVRQIGWSPEGKVVDDQWWKERVKPGDDKWKEVDFSHGSDPTFQRHPDPRKSA